MKILSSNDSKHRNIKPNFKTNTNLKTNTMKALYVLLIVLALLAGCTAQKPDEARDGGFPKESAERTINE
ncbi:MAG: hypothetical protein NTY74_02775 [Ignavibacteriae bacterium]|nr:hypothetical protein [Ignavibacteriota bacterium]